ncbi:MAG: hypothetical protein ACE5JO_02050 [Candidatus Binatia bacterium]
MDTRLEVQAESSIMLIAEIAAVNRANVLNEVGKYILPVWAGKGCAKQLKFQIFGCPEEFVGIPWKCR